MHSSGKHYFMPFVSAICTGFTILSIIGQIIFITYGLTVGIGKFDTEGILKLGFFGFGIAIALGLVLTLFCSWKYWSYDNEGITNGGLLWKRRFLFKDIEYYKIQTITESSWRIVIRYDVYSFFIGKKKVMICKDDLTDAELEWLKSQIENKSK